MISFVLNIPWSFLGLIVALISLPDLKLDFKAKPVAIIVRVHSFWWTFGYLEGVRALTIGQVVILGPNSEKNDLEHELAHIEQYSKFPIIFPILYLLELGKKGYRNNKYEVEAYSKARNIYKEK